MTESQIHAPLVLAAALQRSFKQGGDEIHALVQADCAIAEYSFVAIMGRSGSGKTTLLHLLAGLDDPSSGKVSWPALGASEPLRPSYISIALQTPDLLPALTVLENVALPLLLLDRTPDESNSAARAALEELELADLAEQLPEELSGGQAQRVTLARCLVARPRLILADEPTGQLDHPTAQRLFDLLLAACEAHGIGIVIATHDSAIAARMQTQWQMERGVLQT